jgi:hypothetical protein
MTFDTIAVSAVRVVAGSPPPSPVRSPVPSPPGVDACRPPVRGVVPRLVCGGGPARWPVAVTGWLGHAWPVLAGAGVLAAVLAGLVWVALWRRRSVEARAGRWLEVVPPPLPAAAGGEAFWRLVATVQERVAGRRGWGRGRAVVGVELLARRGRLRVGLWLPAAVAVAAVGDAVGLAWSGAQARPRPVPVPPAGPVAVRWARPAGSDALPVTDPTPRRARPDPRPDREVDPLRGVFAGMAQAAAAGQWAVVQVLARPASRRRVRAAAGQARPGARLVSGPRRVVLDVLDLITPGPAAPTGGGTAAGWSGDPLAADRARAVAGKAAAGPHWEIAVTVAVAGADRGPAGQRAGQIGAGLALLSDAARLSCRRRRFGAGRLASRLPRRSGWWLACLPELAALAHLPYAPGRAGVQAAAGRQVPPPPQLYLTDHDDDNDGDGRWFDLDAA